jgi:beta-lactam-binding protein with PASTA domain
VKTSDVPENTYGQGAVISQFPSADTDVDPKKMPEIELGVSTGYPPS